MGVFESIIGITQVILQRSIGLTLLKESVIGPNIDGVAKILIHSEPFIRAYGTFPHSNILGGFLLVTILTTHLFRKLFHVEHWMGHLLRGILIIQYIGIVTSFSKSALTGLVIALVYIQIVSRGTNLHIMISRRKVYILIALATVVFFKAFPVIKSLAMQSIHERSIYQSVALESISQSPIWGISCGQLVIFMANQATYPLFDWQLQPVHMVFLLIWAELGVFAFILFTLWFAWLCTYPLLQKKREKPSLQNIPRMPMYFMMQYVRAMLLGIIPILFMDHYLWDIQQGQFFLWMLMGSMAGLILYHKDE